MSLADWGDERLPGRFWRNVYPEPNTGCWLWGAGMCDGYAIFSLTKVTPCRRAHRIAWLVLIGEIPEGMVLDHTCEVTSCVNLAHLEVVTPGENTRRGGSPWKANAVATAAELARTRFRCGHPKSWDNVRIHSAGHRLCLACDDRRRAELADRQRRRRIEDPAWREERNARNRARYANTKAGAT